jgi:hypothetical protein
MKIDVRFDMLNFIKARFLATAMDLDPRTLVKNPVSRSIFLPIFPLIQALLMAPCSIE